jgi:outer membrane autotransporter protein
MLTKAPPKPQSFDQRWTMWGSAFGGTSMTNGDPAVGSNNVTASDYGFAGGADYRISRDTVLGFALAGGGTNWSLAQNLGGGRSDAFQAGVYAKTHAGPAYISAALAFANNWFTTDRTSVLGDQLQAKFQGQSVGGRLEAGYRYGLPSTNGLAGFTPYAAVQAQSFHTPSYSETDLTAGGFGLAFNAMNATDTRSELGARADDLTMLGSTPLILRGRVAWAHDWISNPALDAAFQTLPGTNFIVNGAAPPKDSALTSVGAELRMTANWSLLGKFDGEFGSGSQTYAGTGTLRYSW